MKGFDSEEGYERREMGGCNLEKQKQGKRGEEVGGED